MSCSDIPSLMDLQKAKLNVDDFGRLMGAGTGTSTNGVTGQVRPTYNEVLSKLGYTRIGTFGTGGTVLNGRQTLLWDIADGGDGQEYGWSGSFPLSGKVVPPGSTPLTTGGIIVGAWMSRFDPEIMARFDAIDGMGLIGSADYAGIRSYAGNASYIRCSGKTHNGYDGSWFYYRDDSDSTTPDNGGTVIVDAFNRRWKWDFQKNHTGMFWEEYGALIHRVGDRLLIGDAIKNGANVQNQPDWLTQYQLATGRSFGATQTAQVCVQSGVGSNDRGSNVFVAAGQTLNLSDNSNSVGVFGFAVANKPTGSGNAYAGYFEGFRDSDAIGGAYGVEIDSVTYAACGPTDPYQQAANQVIGLQLAAGAELSPTGQFPNNAAVNVRNNGSTYQRGIIFGANSLTGCDGVVGTAIAMEMAKGHGLVWYSGPNQSTSSIYSVSTDATKSNGIVMSDNSLAFVQNVDGKKIFDVEHSVSGAGVNYPAVRGTGAGSPIQILARGEDANIDIHLVPKGDAYVRFGQWTAQGDQAINGFIAIKDAAGNIRKIPTIA